MSDDADRLALMWVAPFGEDVAAQRKRLAGLFRAHMRLTGESAESLLRRIGASGVDAVLWTAPVPHV